MTTNPYDWQRQTPRVMVRPPELDQVVGALLRGHGCVVVGGRGMGKSVLLGAVVRELESTPAHVLRFDTVAVPASVEGCLESVATRLDVRAPRWYDLEQILDAWEAKEKGRHLVLVYDEIDGLGRIVTSGTSNLALEWTAHLEAVRRKRPLGVLVAGGIGVRRIDDPLLGSPFLSRAETFYRVPFDDGTIRMLAEPLASIGRAVPTDGVEALLALTGGIPALVVYCLQQFWDGGDPDARGVGTAISAFMDRHAAFIDAIHRAATDPALGPEVGVALDVVRNEGPQVPRARLPADADGILRLLQAAGMVRLEGAVHVDPVQVRPTAALLALAPRPAAPPARTLRERLVGDLLPVLRSLHGLAPDFRVRGGGIVEEKVFSAMIAVALGGLGWNCNREPVRGAGKTDIVALHPSHDGEAVLEVKIWGRNDYAGIHGQISSYTTDGTRAWAAIMIADNEDARADYATKCLAGLSDVGTGPTGVGIGQWEARVSHPDLSGSVDHFMVVLPRR